MFIIENYSLAVVFCFITMLCWGSWGNTQKLAGSRVWRYELYYWDYVIGVLLLSLLAAFTMGSVGELGRGFVDDLLQADASNLASALIGGVIFNLSNILLSASVSIAGMSVAFPLGVGLALVLGVFINYFNAPQGSPVFLFLGVLLVIVAIVFNAWAYKYNPQIQISAESGTKRSNFRQKDKTKRSKKRLHTTLIKPEQKVNEDLCSGFIVS